MAHTLGGAGLTLSGGTVLAPSGAQNSQSWVTKHSHSRGAQDSLPRGKRARSLGGHRAHTVGGHRAHTLGGEHKLSYVAHFYFFSKHE